MFGWASVGREARLSTVNTSAERRMLGEGVKYKCCEEAETDCYLFVSMEHTGLFARDLVRSHTQTSANDRRNPKDVLISRPAI